MGWGRQLRDPPVCPQRPPCPGPAPFCVPPLGAVGGGAGLSPPWRQAPRWRRGGSALSRHGRRRRAARRHFRSPPAPKMAAAAGRRRVASGR